MSQCWDEPRNARPPEARYANYVKIGHNAHEFLLDFGQLYPDIDEAHLHTRIVTSPIYARGLLETLQESLDRYERAFGSILPVRSEHAELPYLTTAQMAEVDRAMVQDFGIDLIQMMENAGRNLAHLARRRFLGGDPVGKHVIVLAGTGGNAGGALVAARRLHTWGARLHVFVTRSPRDFTGVPAHQLAIVQRMGIPVALAETVPRHAEAELIVDGLLGSRPAGAPRGAAADLIRWANAATAPILALDTPSGLDAATGRVFEPTIRATATLTLALPKEGFRAAEAGPYLGELFLADVSVPPALYASPGLALRVGELFAENEIIRLR